MGLPEIVVVKLDPRVRYGRGGAEFIGQEGCVLIKIDLMALELVFIVIKSLSVSKNQSVLFLNVLHIATGASNPLSHLYILHILPISTKFIYFQPISAKFINSPIVSFNLCFFAFFLPFYFDHDAFMHRTLHVLDDPVLNKFLP